MDFSVAVEPTDLAMLHALGGEQGCSALPTLGEILDVIRAERPDCRIACDPVLRGLRVGHVRVVVRDA